MYCLLFDRKILTLFVIGKIAHFCSYCAYVYKFFSYFINSIKDPNKKINRTDFKPKLNISYTPTLLSFLYPYLFKLLFHLSFNALTNAANPKSYDIRLRVMLAIQSCGSR